MAQEGFNKKLAEECAVAFFGATGLGCMVSDAAGVVLHASGYCCACCGMCAAVGAAKEDCLRARNYGSAEAERFGGKYVYFCPLGLTCFVSPILGDEGSEAKITVGPFLMVERQDYIFCDLNEQLHLPDEALAHAARELCSVPVVTPEKINHLSTLLFMAVGFLNNVLAANRMLDTQSSGAIQSQITAYLQQLKGEEHMRPYPFDTERALLRAVAQANKPEAQRLLNEMFGYIFFSAGGDFEQAKTRVYELLVLISRSAVDAGADPAQTLRLNQRHMQDILHLHDLDALCLWLTRVMNDFMDRVFNYMDAKHANVIHQTIQHLNAHYAEHITLDDMARRVYLSPAYLSRIFKRETGTTFIAYLNKVRVERGKEMLLHKTIRLTDIALLIGFEDQSYFTKVFKKHTGITPLSYRETRGGKTGPAAK